MVLHTKHTSPQAGRRSNPGRAIPRSNVDWKFIHQREGGTWTSGYIPLSTKRVYKGKQAPTKELIASIRGQSGVTVATGFDIGQRDALELARLGLPQKLIEKLAPFCRKKGADAMNALHEQGGLQLESSEVLLIDIASKTSMLAAIQRQYDSTVALCGGDPVKRFSDLNPKIQTAIASYGFQQGQNFQTSTKRKDFVRFAWLLNSQDWAAVERFLRSQPDYRERRRLEADLIREAAQEEANPLQAILTTTIRPSGPVRMSPVPPNLRRP